MDLRKQAEMTALACSWFNPPTEETIQLIMSFAKAYAESLLPEEKQSEMVSFEGGTFMADAVEGSKEDGWNKCIAEIKNKLKD